MSTRTVASLQRQVTPRIHRIYATLILDVPDNEYMLVAHGTDGPIYLDAEDDREALVDTVLELGLADDDEIHVFDDPELPLGRLVPAGVVLREYATDDRRDRLIEDGRLP